MKLRHISIVVLLFCGGLLWVINRPIDNQVEEFIPAEFNGPEQFALLHRGIRTHQQTPTVRSMRKVLLCVRLRTQKPSLPEKFKQSYTIKRCTRMERTWTGQRAGSHPQLIVDPDDPTRKIPGLLPRPVAVFGKRLLAVTRGI
ncbi:MAG: hypothetical protein IPK96_17460 [Flammeovirgaceae bacterium]|nr:hypothetical protein [Flammeovirgaceae bacterium]